jgi:phosphatidylserine/phosphatidylglycerophosphate/cardiolipin synthase-like enzyme
MPPRDLGLPPLRVWVLTQGGQKAEQVASDLIDFLAATERSLDLALYDVRLPGDVGDRVADTLREAASRGVMLRLLYNVDSARPVPVPPPPNTRPELLEALPFPTKGVPGIPDLMHHKFAVRDGRSVWTGSTNWTIDSWQLQENILMVVDSEAIATAYTRDFEELWGTLDVERSGRFDAEWADVGPARVRPWFTPGRGRDLSHSIATAIDRAERVRIASPVLTSGPVLGTLAQVVSDRKADVAGVVDATQLAQVFDQWEANDNSRWKAPLLERVIELGEFTGKRSTPWAPDSIHDFMHAKVTVCDDTAFAGSFNLSRSGELNAENVLEIRDAALADRLATWIDEIRMRYPPMEAPEAGPRR